MHINLFRNRQKLKNNLNIHYKKSIWKQKIKNETLVISNNMQESHENNNEEKMDRKYMQYGFIYVKFKRQN